MMRTVNPDAAGAPPLKVLLSIAAIVTAAHYQFAGGNLQN
jgi:hypothetical protein